MADVEFSNAAVVDLSEIDEFSLAQFGEEIGETYMRSFDSSFALLMDHPHAGAAIPECGKAYRCLVHRQHRILYVIEGATVLIVRILRHARDARRALR